MISNTANHPAVYERAVGRVFEIDRDASLFLDNRDTKLRVPPHDPIDVVFFGASV